MSEQFKYGVDRLVQFPLIAVGVQDFDTAPAITAGDAKLWTDAQIFTDLTAESVAFTSLSELPVLGDTLVGATSTETATFMFAVITSGTVGGGDAAGTLFVKAVSGAFQSENLNIQGGTADVMTIPSDFAAGLFAEIGNGLFCAALTAAELQCTQGALHIVDGTHESPPTAKEFEDQAVLFETWGDPLAQVALDYDLIGKSVSTMIEGTVDTTVAPSSTVFEAADITEATSNHFLGRVVVFRTGALARQASDITDYALVSGRGRFTVTQMTEAPGAGDKFVVI